jgi:hypothetical protein
MIHFFWNAATHPYTTTNMIVAIAMMKDSTVAPIHH